jgi:hypothetical protein
MLLAARDTPENDSTTVRAIDAALARGVSEADLARFDLDHIRAQTGRDPELARLRARLEGLEPTLAAGR